MSTDLVPTTTRRAATRRIAAVTAILAIATLATQLLWWNDLPEPVASHFTFAGTADGFLSRGANLALAAAMVLGLPLVMLAMIRMEPRFTAASRFLGAFGIGLAAFIAALVLRVLAGQRGLADAADATLPGSQILLPLACGAVVGILMYWWLPTADPAPAQEDRAPVMDLATSEQVTWTAGLSNAWFLVLGSAFALGGAIAIPLTEPALGWILLGTGLLLALTFGSVSVTIDHRGVAWRLGIGLIRGRIALSALTRAVPVRVTPTEYGGWGYRISSHGSAIVMKAGPGITFEREGQQDFTITIPDAQTGAAVANGLLARPRS